MQIYKKNEIKKRKHENIKHLHKSIKNKVKRSKQTALVIAADSLK